ncbi:MAG: response regulator [Lachnospiraceae bacterium]
MGEKYKVVIVDDEPIITDGLSTAIRWGDFGCEVAGKAYSGKDGLKVIREIRPDILFTDIRMPGMDGLQMVAALKSEFPGMKIAILTGYRDFDYAQEAIKLGVFRYLVKPSHMQELHDAIADMTTALDAEKAGPQAASAEEEIPEGSDIGQAGNYIVDSALSYIRAHYSEKLSLSDVADNVYCSHWHLSRLLAATGHNFSEAVNSARIEEAKKRMLDPRYHLSDIAIEVGFSDSAQFSRTFKKMTGVSPNEYRNLPPLERLKIDERKTGKRRGERREDDQTDMERHDP